MSNHLYLVSAAFSTILVLSNIFWYRREQKVREGLKTSREWDERSQNTTDAQRSLKQTANLLNISPDEVVDEVATLESKVRTLQKSISDCRDRWASIAFEALLSTPPSSPEVPLVVFIACSDDEDATALAKRVNRPGITLVCSISTGAYSVTVGNTDEWSAVDVARDITSSLSGGAGGSEAFAQGGSDSDELYEKITEVCSEHTGTDPAVLKVGGD